MARKMGQERESGLISIEFYPSANTQGWHENCECKGGTSKFQEKAMFRELTTVPSETLIDLLFATLADGFALAASDAVNIEQIQQELQRRGKEQRWGFRAVH
jgi:hypothetical protein